MSAASRAEMDDDESRPVATLGLSPAFDSSDATMRLAAMTGDEDDAEKTFKIVRPTMDAINQAAPKPEPRPKLPPKPPQPKPPQPKPQAQRQSVAPPPDKTDDAETTKLGSWLLIALAVLVLAGLYELIEVLFF